MMEGAEESYDQRLIIIIVVGVDICLSTNFAWSALYLPRANGIGYLLMTKSLLGVFIAIPRLYLGTMNLVITLFNGLPFWSSGLRILTKAAM